MRVVYLTERLPFGDGETSIIPEIEALLAAGHDVLVVPRRSAGPVLHDDVDALLPRLRRMPRGPAVAAAAARSLASQPDRTARAFWRIRHTRPRRRALSNALATAHGTRLARVARAWRADHIHAHWAHLTATTAMAASALSGIPWSFTAHRYDVVLNNLLDVKLRSARFGRFIARHTLDLARRMIGPEAAARAVVIHVGVRLPPAPRPRPRREVPIVVCPARFARHRRGPAREAPAELVDAVPRSART